MKIGYISDIHCEFGRRDLVSPNIDILAVAGDTHTKPKDLGIVLEQLRDLFKAQVLCVLGNHEYYKQLFPDALDSYREDIEKIDAVSLLEKDEAVIDRVRFLGTTLWSDLSDPLDAMHAKQRLNDFKVIKKGSRVFDTRDYTEEWKKCVAWLNKKLSQKFNGPSIVITHHSPSLVTNNQYKHNALQSCFASDIENMIYQYQPDFWIYGHNHMSAKHNLGKTQLVSNQACYPHEKTGTVRIKCIEV